MKIMQELCGHWSRLVFAADDGRLTPRVRALRLLEEAMELAQAERVTEEEAAVVARQVWSRPAGYGPQELGGVMVTLMGYAHTAKLDAEAAFWDEFKRIMHPAIMEKVRRRNLEGDKIGIEKTDA